MFLLALREVLEVVKKSKIFTFIVLGVIAFGSAIAIYQKKS